MPFSRPRHPADWTRAAYRRGLRFSAYATYDLTNLATLKNWPLGLTLADMAWGSVRDALRRHRGTLFTPESRLLSRRDREAGVSQQRYKTGLSRQMERAHRNECTALIKQRRRVLRHAHIAFDEQRFLESVEC